jgi:hypothetical protein
LANVASLPSAETIALDKEALSVSRCVIFVEGYDLDTRQRGALPSVTLDKVTNITSIPLFNLFLLFHPNKQKIYHIYITDITYTSHISHNHHIHNRDHIFHKSNKFFHKHVSVHIKFHQHKYYQFSNISSGQVYHTSLTITTKLRDHHRGGRLDWCGDGLDDP